jgi:hypothetical protein
MEQPMNLERIESAPRYAAGSASLYDHSLTLGEKLAREHADMQASFMAACHKADANALAPWAPMRNDWAGVGMSNMPRSLGDAARMPKRQQTFAEVLGESLDFTGGPDLSELLQLLLNVAHGADTVNAPAQARALLARMAAAYVNEHAGEDA